MKKDFGSWKVFMLGIGFLIIMLSPKTNHKYITIILGLIVVVISIILFRKSSINNKNKYR